MEIEPLKRCRAICTSFGTAFDEKFVYEVGSSLPSAVSVFYASNCWKLLFDKFGTADSVSRLVSLKGANTVQEYRKYSKPKIQALDVAFFYFADEAEKLKYSMSNLRFCCLLVLIREIGFRFGLKAAQKATLPECQILYEFADEMKKQGVGSVADLDLDDHQISIKATKIYDEVHGKKSRTKIRTKADLARLFDEMFEPAFVAATVWENYMTSFVNKYE